MHTIVLATQKGGSGKSTLTIGLALAAKNAGHKVRLIDTDPQGTLSNWQVRRGIAEPIVETIYNVGRFETRLEQLARGGITVTIVDTASGVGATTAAAIRCADLCFIPARPSVTDIEACAATLKAVRAWRKPFAFVLNQTPVRGRRIDEAAQALGGDAARDISDVLARPFIAMRNDHQDALALGLAVSEYAPAGKSAEEIAQLWRWAEARLNGGALKFPAQEEVNVPALHPDAAQKAESVTAQSPVGDEALTPWDACL
jgi:chromosome partitioning protein